MPATDRINKKYKNINFFDQEKLIQKTMSDEEIKILLDEYPYLAIEYDILCIRLVALIKTCHDEKDITRKNIYPQIIKKTLLEAKQLNQLLYKLYDHTGVHADEKLKLVKHTVKFREFKPSNPPQSPDQQEEAQNFLVAWLQACHTFLSKHNIDRLFTARIRRGLLNIRAMVDLFTTKENLYTKIINNVDAYFLGPVLNYLSWLFLLPRLLVNLFLTAWHTIKHDNLSNNEKKLTWHQRFTLQMRERWSQLANDLVWVPGGILTCFFLIGILNPIGLILGTAMFVWDVLVAIVQAFNKLTTLKHLIKEHKKDNGNEEYVKELENLYDHEFKQQMFNIASCTTILILSALVVPLFSLPVLVPVIASSVLVVLTIVIFQLNRKLIDEKPKPKMDILATITYAQLITGDNPLTPGDDPSPTSSNPSPFSKRDPNEEKKSNDIPTPVNNVSSTFY